MKFLPLVLLTFCCHFANAAALPPSVAEALKRAHIPANSIGIVVQETQSAQPLLSQNATLAMNPASTMKLLTTLVGLETLGPAYRWKTEAYLNGELKNGVLHGDLIFKGYGDPKLSLEQFWLWLRELRQRGLREITGDIILDHSFFDALNYDPAEFDNAPTRAYNVGPNALLLNFNALHLRLIPTGERTTALLEPELAGYTLNNRIVTSAALPCGGDDAYTSRLDGRNIVLEGKIPLNCGEADDYFSLLTHDEYFFALFNSLWNPLGGVARGKLREGKVPSGLTPFSTHLSPPLSEVIRDINKFSNNTMARQLFLTLGSLNAETANIERSTDATKQWLAKNQLDFTELILENGAGLSRKERISPQHLAQLLQHSAHAAYAAELEASLPILGMDGTVKKRYKDSQLAGQAHLKTGTLEGVKSIAGYIRARNGKQWIIVFIINHPNAAFGQPAQDALIEWVAGFQ